MKMKKLVCLTTVMGMMTCTSVFASQNIEVPENQEMSVDYLEPKLTVEVGTLSFDENEDNYDLKGQRALSAPTSFAPDSFYTGGAHNWSGVTNYTYSSYLFRGGDLDVDASTDFTVKYYYPNGNYIGTLNPTKVGSNYQLKSTFGGDYYIVIYNNASGVSKNATYSVYTNQLSWN